MVFKAGPGTLLLGANALVRDVNINEGYFSPGAVVDSVASLTFHGNLNFGPASSLDVDIVNATTGVTYDQIVVKGSLVLGGTLNVKYHGAPKATRGIRLFTFGNTVHRPDPKSMNVANCPYGYTCNLRLPPFGSVMFLDIT
jgi:hypothetical protein